MEIRPHILRCRPIAGRRGCRWRTSDGRDRSWFFYPGDWSTVCTDQMSQVQEEIGRFQEKGAAVLGISVDSPWSHRAWAEERGIAFPLLSDFQREVVEEYGVKHEAGFPERAYFVIDKEGVVCARKIESSPDDQPEVETVLEDLEKAL
ncbi:MAG TPA: redoxin domain-containing protein [Rubrobacteraceae bacterium]|nr:redoxin domain-containing protein [Rubrobacteraceae bacterium]